jgi:hypothetical protein
MGRSRTFKLSEEIVTQISREIFEKQRRPRFGNANPERMKCAFWEWMIRGEEVERVEDNRGLAKAGPMLREGKLKSAYGPHRARDFFKVPMNREHGPIWTFERYGSTRTELPDGRMISIGGEHEDSYDPDFHIYNDVVVFGPEGEIEIYGYPVGVFPPTDSHSATVVGDEIIIVGCLGIMKDRRPGFTPVYSLNTLSYRVSELSTSGAAPGWIFKHIAGLSVDGLIRIRGGQRLEMRNGKPRFKRNNEEFSFDTRTGVWTQTTTRNWPQWSIGQEDGGFFVLDHDVRVRDLIPPGVERLSPAEESHSEARFLLRGVPIRVIAGVQCVEIIAEGELPEELCRKVPETFRRRVEDLSKKKCVLE